MTHAVSGAKAPSGKVCEIAGAPLGFKSVSRNEKMRKGDRQTKKKNNIAINIEP